MTKNCCFACYSDVKTRKIDYCLKTESPTTVKKCLHCKDRIEGDLDVIDVMGLNPSTRDCLLAQMMDECAPPQTAQHLTIAVTPPKNATLKTLMLLLSKEESELLAVLVSMSQVKRKGKTMILHCRSRERIYLPQTKKFRLNGQTVTSNVLKVIEQQTYPC